MVAFVHIHRGASDAAGERAREKCRRNPDIRWRQLARQWRVGRAVGDHPLDDANGACRARREWTSRDGVDPYTPLAAGLVGERSRITLERRLRRRHTAAVA